MPGPHAEAARLANACRWEAARRVCLDQLVSTPNEPGVLSLLVWIDAVTGKTALTEAADRSQELRRSHPGALEPVLVDAAVMYRDGYEVASGQTLREAGERFGHSGALAGSLGAALGQLGVHAAAWSEYQRALELGGIDSARHRYSALRCGARTGARDAVAAIRGTLPIGERLAHSFWLWRPILWPVWLASLFVGVLLAMPGMFLVGAAAAVALTWATWQLGLRPELAPAFLFVTAAVVAISFALGRPLRTEEWLPTLALTLYVLAYQAHVGSYLGRETTARTAARGRPAGPWGPRIAPPMFGGGT